jgi:hypothetical protein
VKLSMSQWKPHRPGEPLAALGLDVSRGGEDECIAALRFHRTIELVRIPREDTVNGGKLASKVLRILAEHPSSEASVYVDATGVGSSVVDCLAPYLSPGRLEPFHGASASKERDIAGNLGFVNRRSAALWTLRERLDPTNPSRLFLPPDQKLAADLTAPTWEATARGVQVQPKQQVHAKLGRSPDAGDATMLAAQRYPLPFWSHTL